MARTVVELAGIAAQRERPGRALSAIVELRERVEELEEFQVENARRLGWSWSEIAQPMGVTRQAVHHKYAKRLEDARRGTGERRIIVTAAARRCVVRARRDAVALRHDSVGTDHLLLGLLGDEALAVSLAPLGITLAQAREAVVRQRRTRRTLRAGEGPIPISTRAREALEQSLREALRLGDPGIGAEHVLLAIVRDKESAAMHVLGALGVTPRAIEQHVERLRL